MSADSIFAFRMQRIAVNGMNGVLNRLRSDLDFSFIAAPLSVYCPTTEVVSAHVVSQVTVIAFLHFLLPCSCEDHQTLIINYDLLSPSMNNTYRSSKYGYVFIIKIIILGILLCVSLDNRLTIRRKKN